ncbi:MAG: sigma-70 family RNA polymerase sigma factor [Phycisphaerales bacterium]|nr:sigma-70 family RNA polymerase sigma factor [Phycisphaerales bacterium]
MTLRTWEAGVAADNLNFEEVALPHMELVYRVARRLSRHDQEAEDLVQETYLKAFGAFGKFELREYGIKPWLLKILHNTFLNRQARAAKAPRAMDQQGLEAQPDERDAQFSPAGLEIDLEQVDGEIKQAIDGLRPEFRSVILLWATMELSYQEIADVLETPIGTVMSRLHRARQQLSQLLAKYVEANRVPGVNERT